MRNGDGSEEEKKKSRREVNKLYIRSDYRFPLQLSIGLRRPTDESHLGESTYCCAAHGRYDRRMNSASASVI